jgi:hypothetical protein
MITPERLAEYKKRAIASVAARTKNPRAPGVTCIAVSPHDLLDLILFYEAADDAAKPPEDTA